MTDFRRRYSEYTLGYLWAILRPLSLFAVLYLFITYIATRFGGVVPNFAVLLLFNIVLFQYFADATSQSVRSLTARGGLVRKMQLPRVVLPLSFNLANALTLGINLVVAFVWILVYGIDPMWTWLLLPAILIPLMLFTVAMSLLVAGLYVRYRDTGEAWPVVSRVFFYASPILFPIQVIPSGAFKAAEAFNPLAPIFVQAQVWFINPDAPGWLDAGYSTVQEITPFVVMAVACVVAVFVFARQARRVAEEL